MASNYLDAPKPYSVNFNYQYNAHLTAYSQLYDWDRATIARYKTAYTPISVVNLSMRPSSMKQPQETVTTAIYSSSQGQKATRMVSKNGVPRLRARRNPYMLAFGMTVAAISLIALMFAAILATASMIWPYNPEVQAGSLHIRRDSGPDDPIPIPCHSHNDYWKPKPFTDAIAAGCIGIEADVWKVRDELMVGHAKGDLSAEKTLTSMYIQPLVNLLKVRNQDRDPGLLPRGVYNREPNQTVVLLVDLKSNPDESWPLLLEQLEPLRQRGWLSHVSDGKFVSRPITVVATGKTEFHLVKEANPSHDVFFDAPLQSLAKGQYDRTNSYYASTSLKKSIGNIFESGKMELIRDQISQAHSRGLLVRYWGMPKVSPMAQRQIENRLLNEGVDVINIGSLPEAKRTFAERRYSND